MFKKITTGLFFISLLSGCVGSDLEYDFSEYEERPSDVKPSFSKEEINRVIELHKETFVDYKKEWRKELEEKYDYTPGKFCYAIISTHGKDKSEYHRKREKKARHLKLSETIRYHAMKRWKKANNIEEVSKEKLKHEKLVQWETGVDIVSKEERQRRYSANKKINAFNDKITMALLLGPLNSYGNPKFGRSIYEWKAHDIIDYDALFVDDLDQFQNVGLGCRDIDAMYFWSSVIWKNSEDVQQKYAPEKSWKAFSGIFKNGPLTRDGEVKPGRCILELKGIDIIDYDKLFFDDEDRERMEAIGREEFEASQSPSHEEVSS